jgi:hypothetical protein
MESKIVIHDATAAANPWPVYFRNLGTSPLTNKFLTEAPHGILIVICEATFLISVESIVPCEISVCAVVWEGRSREAPPIPIWRRTHGGLLARRGRALP